MRWSSVRYKEEFVDMGWTFVLAGERRTLLGQRRRDAVWAACPAPYEVPPPAVVESMFRKVNQGIGA